MNASVVSGRAQADDCALETARAGDRDHLGSGAEQRFRLLGRPPPRRSGSASRFPHRGGRFFQEEPLQQGILGDFYVGHAVRGGSFDYFKSRIGLSGTADTILDSPFNYPDQALLYVPLSAPEPSDPTFPDAVSAIIGEVLTRTQGPTFILFTSLKTWRRSTETFRENCPFP